jgi:hypothetical protein
MGRWPKRDPIFNTCVECGKSFEVDRPSRAKTAKYCSYTCHQIGEGKKGGAVRGEQRKAESQHKSYPKIKGRHAHRIVAERMLGRPLERGETVHHGDENKQNYSEENLVVLPSQSKHIKLHWDEMMKRRKEKHGY